MGANLEKEITTTHWASPLLKLCEESSCRVVYIPRQKGPSESKHYRFIKSILSLKNINLEAKIP